MASVIEEPQLLGREEEPLYEIIDGQKVELPPMSAYAVRIASRLIKQMNLFTGQKDLGEVLSEMLFAFPKPANRNRRPDVAFVSYKRWPKGQAQPRKENAWHVVPNLATEVTSPHDSADDLQERIDEYFRVGVELVWVIYPRRCLVHVYTSLTQVRVLTAKDELDGGSILPGFRLQLADLFLEGPDPDPPANGD